MTDYGTDLDFEEDLDELGRGVEGVTLLAQALWRMLRTAPGSLIDDEEHGFDLFGLLSKPLTAAEQASLPSRIRAAVLRDPRIAQVEVDLTELAIGSWRIRLRVTPGEGPAFDMVGAVDQVAATLLEINEA